MRRRMLRLAVLAVTAMLLASVHEARAEYWAERAGELFRTATRVEVVRVTASTAGSATYVVEQSLRGTRRVGTTDTLVSGYFAHPLPAVGDRVLLVCDSQCPRAFGVDRRGAWILSAQEPGDGAAVMPPIVEDAAVRAMTSSRVPAPLCVRMATRFAQSSAAPLPIDVRVDAATGQGTATGGLLGTPRSAHFGIPFGSGREEDFSLSVEGTRTHVTFNGRVTGRAPDGCLLAEAHVETPVARTPGELTARLGGAPGAVLLARGTIHPIAGVARLAGPGPVSLSAQGGNELTLRFGSAVGSGVEETVGVTQMESAALMIGFHHGPTSATYPALFIEVPHAPSAVLVSASTAVIDALPAGRSVRWRVFYTADGTSRVPAGEIELTGEPAPP